MLSGFLSIIFMLGGFQPYKPLPLECRFQKSTFPAPLQLEQRHVTWGLPVGCILVGL